MATRCSVQGHPVVASNPVEYAARTVDGELDELLAALPAISIEGPRAVGKTATASRRAATAFRLDEPDVRDLLDADRGRLVAVPGSVLLDEWQRHPVLWDRVRRLVDDDPRPGRFLLTGSAVPLDAPTHSGAGRIVTLRMRPMSLAERAIETPTVSLGALLAGGRPPVEGSTRLGAADYAAAVVESGFPAIRGLAPRARRSQLDAYLDRLAERDFPDDGGRTVRDPAGLRRWMAAYAAATATTSTYETIRNAATRGDGTTPARSTTQPYREVLERLFVLDPVPGWAPPSNAVRRVNAPPKHHLADPGLAARLLGLDVDALLDPGRGQRMLGPLFESLVTLGVRVAAQAAEARVAHLRTKGGEHEVDLLVERADAGVVAIEVKLAGAVREEHVRSLRWLADRLGPALVDVVVVTSGSDAYRRPDGIAVVPAALLGP